MALLRALRPPVGAGTVTRGALLGVAALRLARAARARPPLAPDPAGATATATDVTVVVPARDEEARIRPCVESLVAQCARVLVVDDGSHDDTRLVAEHAGADVLDAGPLPPGWAGKAHALQVGIEAATTGVVVCVDADVRARPGAVAALHAALDQEALVTAGAAVVPDTPGGALLHASMLATLVYRLGPPGVEASRPSRAMANGQCMVLDRDRFLATGGMTRVKGALLEDLALARSLAGDGHGVAFLDGSDVVEVEGYGSLGDTWRGWGRSLDLAEVTPPLDQALDLAVVWSTMALPIPRLLLGRGDVLDLVALSLRVGTAVGSARALRGPRWPLALAPLVDAAVAARITWGTLRPSRTWRGRDY